MAHDASSDFPINKIVLYEEGLVTDRVIGGIATKKLRILHFNDVYNIESRTVEPCGGASRFLSALEYLSRNEPTLVLFSGDAFSPSNLSTLMKGKQMVEILNLCNIKASCVGNHDFDFGIETLTGLIKGTKFPWLLSNVIDSVNKQPLAGAHVKLILDFNGVKIGIMGIVEEEWMSTLSTIDYDEVDYESYILAGKRLAKQMKKEDANDEIFVNSVPEIDLFLGGHDHQYECKHINDRWLVKSGTDFRDLTIIEINIKSESNSVTLIERYTIESIVREHEQVKEIVDGYMKDLNKELDIVLGEVKVDLDGRFQKVRLEETNLGNFICDIILEAVDAECCILNSGSFRSDTLHPAGQFKIRDLKAILPYVDGMCVISITGRQLHEALENGVSQYPKLEGRFPQVGGIRFEFDPREPSGNRIDVKSIKIQNEPVELDKIYTLATKAYLAEGKDGYNSFKHCPMLVEDEYIPPLFNLVENHFNSVSKFKQNCHARFRSSIVPLIIINRLIRLMSNDPEVFKNQVKKDPSQKHITFRMAALLICKTLKLQRVVISRKDKKLIKQSPKFQRLISEYEIKSSELAPKVENRIVCLVKD